MKTPAGGLSLVFLLAGLLTSFPGRSIAAECKSGASFAENIQLRCLAHFGKSGIVDTKLSGDSLIVAVFSGPPKDGVACNGSLTVGDNVGWYGNATPGTITDINLIEQGPGEPSMFNHHVSDVITAGWLYRDERGNYWAQMNGRALPSISSKTRAFFASLGLHGSDGHSVVTTGHHPRDVRSAHLQVQRCWSDGSVFASAD